MLRTATHPCSTAIVTLGLLACASLSGCRGTSSSGQAPAPSVSATSNAWTPNNLGMYAGSSMVGDLSPSSPGQETPSSTRASRTDRSSNPMFVGLYGETGPSGPGHSIESDGNLFQVSFASEGADFDPDMDPSGRFVVYASTQHQATSDLYRKTVDGRTITQLTSDPGNDMMPSISPDGAWIAYASDRSGNWDIYIMSIDGGQTIQVTSTNQAEIHPTWSPDGSTLAWCRRGMRSQQWEIWTCNAHDAGGDRFITYGLFPQWSPAESESKILFQRARQRGSRFYGIWTIDIDGGQGSNPTEIASAANAAAIHPSWSPDGMKIAFTTVLDPDLSISEWPETADIWSINRDGTGRVQLTSGSNRNMQPSWGGDGRVYFVSNRGGTENIWSVQADFEPLLVAPDPPSTVAEAGFDQESE